MNLPDSPESSEPSELYQAIERSALRVYGALLSPDLAEGAARAFATETTAMVQDLLDDGVSQLRDKIESQLSALNGGGKTSKKKTTRKANGTKTPRAKKTATASAKAAPDRGSSGRKSESTLVTAAKRADRESATLQD